MRLLLLRHGRTHGNTAGALDTAPPGLSLTELGQRQAEAAARALAERRIEQIFVSTLARTHETAAPLASTLGLEPRVLEGLRSYAQGKGTQTEILDDTHVRITRLIEGPQELVWRAHTEPELMKQWLLGPDGWRMSVCEIDPSVGGTYRYAWEPVDSSTGQEGFGFDGETLLSEPPRRAATTEHMTGTDYPSTLNDLNLEEEDGATLITLLIEYPDMQTRDIVLATGMTDGMEAGYARLEGVLAGV